MIRCLFFCRNIFEQASRKDRNRGCTKTVGQSDARRDADGSGQKLGGHTACQRGYAKLAQLSVHRDLIPFLFLLMLQTAVDKLNRSLFSNVLILPHTR